MNVFDQWVKHRLVVETQNLASLRYARYADDFVFLSHDRKQLESIIPAIQQFLAELLRLTLHPNKIIVKTFASGVDFLGWVHFPGHRIVRRTTKRRMFTRIREHAKEETVQSYMGLFKHGNTKTARKELLGQYWFWQ